MLHTLFGDLNTLSNHDMTPLSGSQVGYDLEPRVASIQVSAWSETDRGLMQTAF